MLRHLREPIDITLEALAHQDLKCLRKDQWGLVNASKDGVEKYPTPEISRSLLLGDVCLASRERGRSMSFRAR
jgi:hypothetical protein